MRRPLANETSLAPPSCRHADVRGSRPARAAEPSDSRTVTLSTKQGGSHARQQRSAGGPDRNRVAGDEDYEELPGAARMTRMKYAK